FEQLAQCESNGNWQINTGNGFYGGLQFMADTWRSVGGSGLPHEASKAEQIYRGHILQQRSGWSQWPACTSMLGWR
ncbi:MAG: transglycosylase family protein, partial [Actinomycetota bacterium]